MMDDEPWIIEDPSESVEEPPAEEAPAAEATAEGEAEGEVPPEEVVPPRDPNAPLILKHWVRPKFLQYGYMEDYRRNYYDDVIDYLDRRQRGIMRETPRAQTWAERALRTYVSKPNPALGLGLSDHMLLVGVPSAPRFRRYYSKSRINRKYSRLGFNTVNV